MIIIIFKIHDFILSLLNRENNISSLLTPKYILHYHYCFKKTTLSLLIPKVHFTLSVLFQETISLLTPKVHFTLSLLFQKTISLLTPKVHFTLSLLFQETISLLTPKVHFTLSLLFQETISLLTPKVHFTLSLLFQETISLLTDENTGYWNHGNHPHHWNVVTAASSWKKNNPRNIQWDNTLLLVGLGVVYALQLVIQNVSKDFWSLFQ